MNTDVAKERYLFIDVARGISIICIVLGHLGVSSINRFVFTFHVPVFFLLSGYFTNAEVSFKEHIKKKAKTLIVPYVLCCIVICILAVLINQILEGGAGNKQILLRWICASLYGAGDNYQQPFTIYGIGAIWFLLASFWGSILLKYLLNRTTIVRAISVFGFFLLCVLSRRICWLPLSIQAAGPALLFMYLGYLAKSLVPFIAKLQREVKIVFWIFVFWIWIEFIRDFKSFWLVHCDYGRGGIDIFGSLCACCCILLISYGISNIKCKIIANGIGYLGKYSLLVLSMHMVELAVFPWSRIGGALFTEMTDTQYLWLRIIGKFLWIIPTTVLLSKWSISRRLWGYKPLVHSHN